MIMAIKLAEVKDIPEGTSIVVRVIDGREVALFNRGGRIFALNNACPHMGGPLGEGCLEGFMVTCPWHGWEFDIRDGVCANMPGDDAQTLKIRVDNGSVFLE